MKLTSTIFSAKKSFTGRALCIAVILLAVGRPGRAFAQKIDSFPDVNHYSIYLDCSFRPSNELKGKAEIKFNPRYNADAIVLQLRMLKVYSVSGNLAPVFSQSGDNIIIRFGQQLKKDSSYSLAIQYGGVPYRSSFGGFTVNPGGISYNMGIDIQSVPPQSGKSWFPCVDNFSDRATYDFYIHTRRGFTAACNGALISQKQDTGNTSLFHWQERVPIPAYLAACGVGPYQPVRTSIFNSFTGKDLPIHLYCLDSIRAKKHFDALPAIVSIYQSGFGPYIWEKIGYCETTNSGGAMEHAGCIMYPPLKSRDDSDKTLMAHELSHHWWGNLITCASTSDMWINEGFASFCEDYYLEKAESRERMLEHRRKRLHLLLGAKPYAAQQPVWPAPDNDIYGAWTYYGGAQMAHTLRSLLGPALFESWAKTLMKDFALTHISTAELIRHIHQTTGYDADTFFQTYLSGSRWPIFTYNYAKLSGNSLKLENAHAENSLESRPYPTRNLSFTAWDENGKKYESLLGGEIRAASPIQCWAINADGDFAERTIKTLLRVLPGEQQVSAKDLTLTMKNSSGGEKLIMAEMLLDAPNSSAGYPPYMRLSDKRYWRLTGTSLATPGNTLRFDFNYNPASLNGFEYELVKTRPDSLLLLYRANPATAWSICPNAALKINPGKSGFFTVEDGLPGEYVFAVKDVKAHVKSSLKPKAEVEVALYPNPATDRLMLRFNKIKIPERLILSDSNGKILRFSDYSFNAGEIQINTSTLPNGAYTYHLQFTDGTASGRFIVQR